MKVQSHLEKIAKLEALRERLDPAVDFELWFWAGMTAGTHAVNAALHQAAVTRDDDAFPTQPGAYLVPQADGSLKAAFGPLGDVLAMGAAEDRGAGAGRCRGDDAPDGDRGKVSRPLPARRACADAGHGGGMRRGAAALPATAGVTRRGRQA